MPISRQSAQALLDNKCFIEILDEIQREHYHEWLNTQSALDREALALKTAAITDLHAAIEAKATKLEAA